MRSTARQPFGERSEAATGKFAAALLISAVTGPSSPSIASNAAAMESGSRTSTSIPNPLAPTASTALTPAARCSSLRLAIATLAPSRANSTPIALPSPVPPPVTSTTCPS